MKRVLLLGMILAICILAMPQGVSAATADVTANIQTISILTAAYEPTVNPWVLQRLNASENINANAINISVDCNTDWDVNVKDTKTSNPGYMNSTTSSKKLFDKFQLEEGQDANTFATLTNTAWIIESGTPIPKTIYKQDIKQQVENVDDAAEAYTITLTYTLVPK